jgi:hypothetical protein
VGVLQQMVWARDPETYAHLKDHQQRPIEEKESNKWLLSLESVIVAHEARTIWGALRPTPVVAWKISCGTMLARAMPGEMCTIFFEPEEWQAAFCVLRQVSTLLEETPALRKAIRMVAQLGGFIGRKGDGGGFSKTHPRH